MVVHPRQSIARRPRPRLHMLGLCLGLLFGTATAQAHSVDEAQALMDTPDPGLVDQGIEIIGLIGSREAGDVLLQRMRRGLPAKQLELAMVTVANMDLPEAQGTLVSLLSHRRPEIRALACKLLANMDAASALQALTGRLSDSSRKVRSAAAKALGTLGDAGVVPLLFEALSKGNLDAARAIGKRLRAEDAERVFDYLDQVPLYHLTPALSELLLRKDVSTDLKLKLVARIRALPHAGARGFLDSLGQQEAALDTRVSAAIRKALAEMPE